MSAGQADAVASVERGARIDGFTVLAPASRGRQAVVLQARDGAGSVVALKVATTEVGARLLEHEVRILDALGPGPAPAPSLIATGRRGELPYCATAWARGAEARIVAGEARAGASRMRPLELCRAIARAYSTLHEHGALHGQVHPRHVLVDSDVAVVLLDLSLAATTAGAPSAALLDARFNSLSAPETAQALLDGEKPALTAAAEQYSVAALLYLLLTGRMYARLRLDRPNLAHDIIDSAPVAFSAHGSEPWPALEAVLAAALDHDPDRRHASMGTFAGALDALAAGAVTAPPAAVGRPSIALAGKLQTFWHDVEADATAALPAPTCSVNFGAAGVAYALTRLGKTTAEPRAFELAEWWLAVARSHRSDAGAFDDGDQLTPQTVGRVSPFHAASGIAAVEALLADAGGDRSRQQRAIEDYRAATTAPTAGIDLTLGRSSVLLVAGLLYARADPGWPAAQRLRAHGDQLSRGIWGDLPNSPPAYNGIAHGWAGIAYASMIWASARGGAPPSPLRGVLELLAAAAEPNAGGLRWPVAGLSPSPGDQYWPGWCHGNAGYVFLWNLAHTLYGEDRFAELAERAAAPLDTGSGVSSLCCGSAGLAYAALNQYRSTGEERWRRRALRIASHAAEHDALAGDATTPLSLYKGHVGLALLAVELERPECAAMPLFEYEPPPVQT